MFTMHCQSVIQRLRCRFWMVGLSRLGRTVRIVKRQRVGRPVDSIAAIDCMHGPVKTGEFPSGASCR